MGLRPRLSHQDGLLTERQAAPKLGEPWAACSHILFCVRKHIQSKTDVCVCARMHACAMCISVAEREKPHLSSCILRPCGKHNFCSLQLCHHFNTPPFSFSFFFKCVRAGNLTPPIKKFWWTETWNQAYLSLKSTPVIHQIFQLNILEQVIHLASDLFYITSRTEGRMEATDPIPLILIS